MNRKTDIRERFLNLPISNLIEIVIPKLKLKINHILLTAF